jgi:tRNA dimethylallyltransferase
MGREALAERISARTGEIASAGAAEARRAAESGASRTARAAIGFDELLAGDLDGYERAQRQLARRQLTWMRKLEGVRVIDRTGHSDDEVAAEIVALD